MAAVGLPESGPDRGVVVLAAAAALHDGGSSVVASSWRSSCGSRVLIGQRHTSASGTSIDVSHVSSQQPSSARQVRSAWEGQQRVGGTMGV